MKKVLFIGDINVDIIMGGLESQPLIDREIGCSSYQVAPGSTAVIAACSYATLGGNASFSGLAGEDEHGRFMLQAIAGFGVETELIRTTATVNTGVTVNLIHQETRTQITYPGTIAEFDGQGIEGHLAGFDHLHFAGPYQQTKLRPRITALLQAASEAQVTVSLDPQWDARERWEHLPEWLPLLSYLFVNEAEAQSITSHATTEKALEALASQTTCPIVKAGRSGCYAYLEGRVAQVPTRAIRIVDSTGAGDCFDAGFLFCRLEKRMNLLEACRFACAMGTRSCLYVGGLAAPATYTQVIDFLGE